MLQRIPVQLIVAAIGLLALPPVLIALGLTMTSATEVVVFGIACMALNVLVGHTGLVSFGHGAWFGLAAYAAALLQRNLMPGSFLRSGDRSHPHHYAGRGAVRLSHPAAGAGCISRC